MKEESFEGFEMLYGNSARENDRISTEIADGQDFWFHAAGYAGAHLIVRNPDGLKQLPKSVEKRAAELAVLHSKAKNARGKIEVHVAFARDVKKPKGMPAGKVLIKNYWSVKVYSPN